MLPVHPSVHPFFLSLRRCPPFLTRVTLHRLKISHTDECPCVEQDPRPLNTFSNTAQPTTLSDARRGLRGAELREKLWGCRQDPEKTVDFVSGKRTSDLDSMTEETRTQKEKKKSKTKMKKKTKKAKKKKNP